MDSSTLYDEINYTVPIPLIRDVIDGKVLIVIGAGISTVNRVISTAEIAETLFNELVNDLKKEGKSKDVLALEKYRESLKDISQKYQLYYKNNKAKDKVKTEILDSLKNVKTTLFKQLAKLPICDIVTTNYDRLIENNQDKSNCSVIWEKKGNMFGKTNKVCTNIIKMHGDIEDSESMTLTRTDFDDYDREHPHILEELTKRFEENTILIIGYSLEDDNFRRIFSAHKNNIKKKCYWVAQNKFFFREEEWPQVEFIYRDAEGFLKLFAEEVDRYQNDYPKETISNSLLSGRNHLKDELTYAISCKDLKNKGKLYENVVQRIFEMSTNFVVKKDVKRKNKQFDLVIEQKCKSEGFSESKKYIYVECKNTGDKAGVEVVEKLGKRINDTSSRFCNTGIVVSGNGFTKEAISEATKFLDKGTLIILLNNGDLFEMIEGDLIKELEAKIDMLFYEKLE